MWIAQNIQNPYGAQFASSFTNGFLHGLFANDTPQAQAAQLALQQQQAAQAEREREEAQRRIDAEFARLNSEAQAERRSAATVAQNHRRFGSVAVEIE